MDDCTTCIFARRVGDLMTCSKQAKVVTALKLVDNDAVRARHVMQKAAQACGSYEVRTSKVLTKPTDEAYLIGMPSQLAMSSGGPGLPDNRVGSCKGCVFAITDPTTADGRPITSNLVCGMRGTVINPTKLVSVAQGCDTKKLLDPMTDVSDKRITPLGELLEGTAPIMVPPSAPMAPLPPVVIVDPTEYESDKPLTDDDIEAGIRAWRKIVAPHDRNLFTHLPIFRREFFTDEEAEMIPNSGDDEHPEMYHDHFDGVWSIAVQWQELDEVPALWGEAGTGKTEIGRHLAWLMQMPFYRFSITARTELDDLAGKTHYHPDKGTYFKMGRFARAYGRPGVLILDEPNAAAPEVWQFLRPVLDSSKQLVLDMNEGEKVKRHDSSYLMLAMNPAWDVRNLGVEQLADADTSRLVHVEVPFPPEKIERQILTERASLDGFEISEEQLDFIMRVAIDLRRLTKDGTLPISWGIRPQIQVARMLKWHNPQTAYRRAVSDALEPQVRELISDTVKAHTSSPRARRSY